jgi:hypothetical protein
MSRRGQKMDAEAFLTMLGTIKDSSIAKESIIGRDILWILENIQDVISDAGGDVSVERIADMKVLELLNMCIRNNISFDLHYNDQLEEKRGEYILPGVQI